ncbi:MAG: ArsR/SmtB family transcription factor [Rhodospirillales bacterium]
MDVLCDNGAVGVTEAAQGFAAMGAEPRLAVLTTLVRAGPEGLNVGAIQERLGIPASTLAHHLRFLAAAGLIDQERQGRNVINKAAFDYLERLAHYLLDQCCADRNGGPARHHGLTESSKGTPS